MCKIFRLSALVMCLPLVSNCGVVLAEPIAPPAGVIKSEQADFTVELLAGDLDFPWGIAFLPDGSMLVTERLGRLRLIQGDGTVGEPLANVPKVYVEGQGGLLDVAVDPSYEDNGWIYLSYAGVNSGAGSSTHVARARLAENALSDVQVIFRSDTTSSSRVHWGSRIVFDREGRLLFSVGERGNGDNSQDLGTHGGSMIRLNPDGTVPKDNPFVGQDDAEPEIFSYGHRNPQGLAIRAETGQLFEQEHGPQGGDEINIIEPGANYGWPLVTWGVDYGGSAINDGLRELEGTIQPIFYWDPSIAPSGMAFYEGDAFPEWKGDLLVGALKFQLLSRLEMEGDEVLAEERMLSGQLGRIRDVEVGPDGYVYLLNDDPEGGIYRLVPAN